MCHFSKNSWIWVCLTLLSVIYLFIISKNEKLADYYMSSCIYWHESYMHETTFLHYLLGLVSYYGVAPGDICISATWLQISGVIVTNLSLQRPFIFMYPLIIFRIILLKCFTILWTMLRSTRHLHQASSWPWWWIDNVWWRFLVEWNIAQLKLLGATFVWFLLENWFFRV